MPRSGVEARNRLRDAALELYLERGYDATTTAEIAERAGVTERTYFRHFADKREVLFDGEAELRTVMVDAITAAPRDLLPLDVVIAGYVAAIPLFVANRPMAERRARVIEVTPALQERAYAKIASLGEAIVEAVTERGTREPTARLAAEMGRAVFNNAAGAWAGHPRRDLAKLLARAAAEARAM